MRRLLVNCANCAGYLSNALIAHLAHLTHDLTYSFVHDQLPPPLWRAPKFQIRYAHPISLGCHQLYIIIVANSCGYTQRLFWLPWRIILVGQGKSWLARGIELKQLRMLTLSLFCPCLCQNANTMLSLQLPMKFGNIVWVETSRYLTKITTLRRKADREGSCSFATITMCSWWQPSEVGCA